MLLHNLINAIAFVPLQIVPAYYIECQNGGYRCRNDTIKCDGTNPEPQTADTQQWYIEHLHGHSDERFLIISMLNGKALYCKGPPHGLCVEATERNDNDVSQHWKREDSYIVSKKFNTVFFMRPETHDIVLNERNVNDKKYVTFSIRNVSI